MLELIGIIGGLTLSYSNVPQLVMFFRQKHAKGISKASNWIALVGVVFRGVYTYSLVGPNPITFGPYAFSLFCIVVTMYYCHFPKKELL